MKARKRFLFGVFTTAVALALFWAGKRGTACAAEQHAADPPAQEDSSWLPI